jgi:uncharacterized membrane protein YhiD involved in acid resistance
MIDLVSALEGTSVTDVRIALVSILLAFALAHLVAASYSWTHRGLSYSRSFVHALVMGGVVASMLMLAIGNNLVWGIGIVGTLAIIRFRTNLRDPRDMVYVFAALAAGIAAGVRAYAVGILGTAVFWLVSLYLARVPFGARNHFDALLRFSVPAGQERSEAVAGVLRRHCADFVLVSLQQILGEETEHAYQVRFRRESDRHELVRELSAIRGVSNLSLLLQETQVDI